MGPYTRRRRRWWAAAAVAAVITLPTGCGDDFPTRDVRLYVGVESSDPAGELVREYARLLGAELGVGVEVVHRPDHAGVAAVTEALSQPADGHTVAVATAGQLTAAPALHRGEVSYSGAGDWTSLGGIAEQQHGLMALSRSGWQSLDDFVDEARQRPGELAVGVSGLSGVDAMAVAALMAQAQVDVELVAFDGGAGEASVALLGERTDALHGTLLGQHELLLGGALVSLGHTGAQAAGPVASTPYRELGYDVPWGTTWYAYAPPGLPGEVERRLAQAHRAVVGGDAFGELVTTAGHLPHPADARQMRGELDHRQESAAACLDLLRAAGWEPLE